MGFEPLISDAGRGYSANYNSLNLLQGSRHRARLGVSIFFTQDSISDNWEDEARQDFGEEKLVFFLAKDSPARTWSLFFLTVILPRPLV